MIMTKIKTLKDKGEVFYPQTHINAVVDDNGNTVNELVDNVDKKIPTKVSQLENDKNYALATSVQVNTIAINNEVVRATQAEQVLSERIDNIPLATTENDGLMSAEDKIMLNASIKNVDVAPGTDDVELDLEDNTDKITHVVFPAATTESAGVMSAEDKRQISRINAEILDKKLHLQEAGYYESYGYVSTINAKNTGLVYFKEYSSVICTSNLASDALLVAFFDADCKLLKDISVKAGTAGWKTDVIDLTEDKYENAEYLAVSCYDATGTFAQFDAVLTNPESIEQRLSQVEAKTDFELEDIIEKQAPLTETGFYDLRGNKTNTSNAMNTGIVPVNGYKRLEYRTNLAADAAAVLFYDTSKMLITALSVHGTSGFETKILDLTEEKYANIGYIRVSCYDGTGSFAQFDARLYNDNTLEYRISSVERLKEIMPSNDRPLNILIFGDSITDSTTISVNGQQQTTSYKPLENGGYITDESGATVRFSMWPHLITKYISCFDVRNYAKSGASYTEKAREAGNERQNLSYQIQLALNDKSNPNGVFPTAGEYIPDIVIFALGTNDATPTGSYDEAMSKTVMSADGKSFDVDATLANLDITTTCDAIRYAFLKIKQAFPLSLCLCVLPIQRADSERPNINEVLERMARRYSIKVIDGAAELGIVRDLEVSNGSGACLKDGLHPNDKGHKLYARMMVNAIKNNYIDMSLMD